MRLLAGLLILGFVGSSAAADPTKPSESVPAKQEVCKRRVVGRGLDRKVVCEFTAPVVVRAGAPKPKVLVVPTDGRSVVGRPRSDDRLRGLGPRTN